MPSISPGALPHPALLPCIPPHWPALPLSHPRQGQHPEGETSPWPVAFQAHHFSQLLPWPIFSSPLTVPPLRSGPELCTPADQGSPGSHVLPIPKTALLPCHFTHLSCHHPQPLVLPCSPRRTTALCPPSLVKPLPQFSGSVPSVRHVGAEAAGESQTPTVLGGPQQPSGLAPVPSQIPLSAKVTLPPRAPPQSPPGVCRGSFWTPRARSAPEPAPCLPR